MEVRNLLIISIQARLVLIDHIVDQRQNKSLRHRDIEAQLQDTLIYAVKFAPNSHLRNCVQKKKDYSDYSTTVMRLWKNQ